MRVARWFAFVDPSGFTSFSDEHGDDESVRVLTDFRHAVRKVASEYGVRIAKWLGDGCMLVGVEAGPLVDAVCALERAIDELGLPLSMHAGVAGGPVILLEGDDDTGGPVNLASRLCERAGPHEILTTPDLGDLAPDGAVTRPAGIVTVVGMHRSVEVVCLGCGVTRPRERT